MMKLEYAEGATPLDPEEKEGLKLSHITNREELDAWEQRNIQKALIWIKRRREKGNILNEAFLCELHRRMFGDVWKWAGKFRRTNKNIGVDWHNIAVEVRALLDEERYWVQNNTYSSDEIAFRFHHRLVAIHPFPNGNGRHSRLMTDVLITEILNAEMFSWGTRNLIDNGDERKKYINALKAADDHNYDLLREFVRS